MFKQPHFRVIMNLVLIVIIVIGVVAVGIVSIKEYQSKRIPAMFSDEEIIELAKKEYTDFEFDEDDTWNIDKRLSDNHQSFIADIEIDSKKDNIMTHYGLKMTFILFDGAWRVGKPLDKITSVTKGWLYESTSWSVIAEDGTEYEISFLPDFKAKLCIHKPSDKDETEVVLNNAMNEGENENSAESANEDHNAKESDTRVTCELSKSEDGKSYNGTFEISKDEVVSLIVSEDSVTIKTKLNNKEGELILIEKSQT